MFTTNRHCSPLKIFFLAISFAVVAFLGVWYFVLTALGVTLHFAKHFF